MKQRALDKVSNFVVQKTDKWYLKMKRVVNDS